MVNEMATKKVKNSKYKEWINIYSGKTINAMMDEVTNITNMLYKKASNCEKKRMYEFFRKGLELEIMFWDEAYYSKYTSIKAH